jgi:hypothetical protein
MAKAKVGRGKGGRSGASAEALALPPSTREGLSALGGLEGGGSREAVAERMNHADSPVTRKRRAASVLATLQRKGLAAVKDGVFTLTAVGRRLAAALREPAAKAE